MRDRHLPVVPVVCVLILPLVALLVHPWVERGLNDDWSYIRSAQLLAQTGHIVYNGWSTASLGWQLFLGALFIKLFGFSFSAVRASTLLVSMLTALLFHSTLIRCGLNQWNSAIGTLTLILSPLFLPLTFSFMSDIGGLFVILLCLYACLRALSASSSRAALLWLAFAALSNAFGGSIRQIAWLGVILMVPSTLWLLRRKYPQILVPVEIILALSYAVIFATMHWFSHQPYTIPEPLIPGSLSLHVMKHLAWNLIHTFLEFPFFLLPVLAMFLPALSRRPRTYLLLAFGVLPILLAGFELPHSLRVEKVLFPQLVNYISADGFMAGTPLKGVRPVVLTEPVRVLLTALTLFAAFSFLSFLLDLRQNFSETPGELSNPVDCAPYPSWRSLAVILGPFTLAYIGLLLPRAIFGDLFDRYLVTPIAIAILVLLRLFQQHIEPNQRLCRLALGYSLATLVLFAGYAICGTHDMFALVRAEQTATSELLNAGIDPSAIDGGFEFNGWNQIQRTGFVTDRRLFPANWSPNYRSDIVCQPEAGPLFPSLVPRYALSFEPALCQGATDFPPVAYHTWLPARENYVYIIHMQSAPYN